MSKETFTFQTEVGRLLDIVAHSLYTHKEIFLRELISNASDACDKLRYAALSNSDLIGSDHEFQISLAVDEESQTLSISDNGIGMNRQDLLDTLGTIARSGTQDFLKSVTGDSEKDVSLIGQFGVGFYSAFVVADEVEVVTRKAGEDEAWLWTSDGKGSFAIDAAERPVCGTTISLHLKADAAEFLQSLRLKSIVKKYSDHIGFPIVLAGDEDGETLNAASALWMRPKSEITDEQYKEFYHHVSHAFDDPWLTVHNTVEGLVSYTNLLFVPSTQPMDLFDVERRSRVKLYVRRVFITDDCEGLFPAYLRFFRGVVDSEDLPLNISRELFQNDPKLAKIRSSIVKRCLDDLAKKAKSDEAAYHEFWEAFGAVLKEGLYEDHENREKLLDLCRFRTSSSDTLTSLSAYVEGMKAGQSAIYTINGDDATKLRSSPQLEAFKAKDIDVLLLTDPIDEFWISTVRTYQDKPFQSVTSDSVDLSTIEDLEGDKKPEDESESKENAETQGNVDALISIFEEALADAVKSVRVSKRLTDSAVCLVSADGDVGLHLEKLLRQHGQMAGELGPKRILEVNAKHPLIRRMADHLNVDTDKEVLTDAAFLLLDQARIIDGEPPIDPSNFARRLATVLEHSLPA
jgi:molecular chaperone HtpG